MVVGQAWAVWEGSGDGTVVVDLWRGIFRVGKVTEVEKQSGE